LQDVPPHGTVLEMSHGPFDDMASRTVYGREPTPNQHKYLHSLF
jgi:hypothetical protein